MEGALSGTEGQGVGEQEGSWAQEEQVLAGKQEGSGVIVGVGCGLGGGVQVGSGGGGVGED